MSAFVVDRNHIEFLVASALNLCELNRSNAFRWRANGAPYQLAPGDQEAADRVGQMLWDENIRSVLHRYPGDTRETMPGPCDETFEYRHDFGKVWPFKAAEVFKACHCWEYQTCETPDHEQTDAWAFVQALQRAAASHVPGYEAAPWGAPEPSSMIRLFI